MVILVNQNVKWDVLHYLPEAFKIDIKEGTCSK